MRDEVAAAVPEAFATTSDGTPGLDLPAGVVAQLAARGVAVTRVERCTLEDPELFSHRRASVTGVTTGRQAGVVALF
jgi:copper oxidase (laccase) domain-containing protein